jgi:hypothetical protein
MNYKKSVLAMAVAGLAIGSVAHADLKISGQVNQRAIVGGDLKDDISVADNTMTGTRFRLTGDTQTGGITAGFRYEIQLRANNSAAPGSTAEEETSGFKGNFGDNEVRWADTYLKGSFGKVSLGRGEPAASNTADATYGNGNFYSTPNLVWLAYQGAVIDEGLSGIGAKGFDADSGRISRIQYDSPNFSGFSFAASLGNDDNTAFALRYQGKVGPGTLKARYGSVEVDNTSKGRALSSNVDRQAASFLYQFDMGLNIGGSFGTDDVNSDNDYDHFAIGWKKGKLGASVEVLEDDGDDKVTTMGATYKVTKGATVYINRADFDNAGTADDYDGIMVGMHVKF